MQHNQNQRLLEAKHQKITENKTVLKEHEATIRDLTCECEKLRIMLRTQMSDLSGLAGVDLSSLSKEKLIYELGGKDGANYALKFIDVQAQQRDEINRLVGELSKVTVQNSTLRLLIEDKTVKEHKAVEEYKKMKAAVTELENKLEKIEYQN